MLDTNLLMLGIGPVSVIVRADRQSKGISEAQLEQKREIDRALETRGRATRRAAVRVTVDLDPMVRVECKRSSS